MRESSRIDESVRVEALELARSADQHRLERVDPPSEAHPHPWIVADVLMPGTVLGWIDVELAIAHDVVELHGVGIVRARLEIDEAVFDEGPVFDRLGHDLAREGAARKDEEGSPPQLAARPSPTRNVSPSASRRMRPPPTSASRSMRSPPTSASRSMRSPPTRSNARMPPGGPPAGHRTARRRTAPPRFEKNRSESGARSERQPPASTPRSSIGLGDGHGVAASEAQARAVSADLWPQIDASVDSSRRRSNFIGLPIPGRENEVLKSFSTSHGVALNLSWEIDLWGRIRAGRDAELAGVLAVQADFEAARLSLSAQTARVWFAASEAELQRRLAVETVESLSHTTRLIRARYERGLRPPADLRLALSNLAQAEAVVERRRRELDGVRRQLETLAGHYPAGKLSTRAELTRLPPLDALATGVPSELVTRRPDLIASEQRLAASGARVHEARALLYPKLRLLGSGGTTSGELEDLVDLDFLVWSIAGNLTQPILQGGRIRAGIDRAEARRIEATESYLQAALTAFREVETALAAEGLLAEQERALREAAEHAQAAVKLSQARYASGLGEILFVLDAERRAFDSRSALLGVRRARLDNRIDLHLALGGGIDVAPAMARQEAASELP